MNDLILKILAANDCDGVKTSILNVSGCNDGTAIFEILSIALNVMTFGVGAGAVLGFLISGYQYMSARDNSAVVAKAKNRMLQIVIGLVIWAVFWGVLQFILPGGIFANGSTS